MIEKKLALSQIEDVKGFVNIAMAKNYDIDLSCGKYTVNAKSIMGIFSLDLTKPLMMKAYCSDEDNLEDLIRIYEFKE